MAWLAPVAGAGYGYIEWLAAPAGQPLAASRAALRAVIDHIEKTCRTAGIKILFVSTPHPALARCIERTGFILDSSKNTHLYKHITP